MSIGEDTGRQGVPDRVAVIGGGRWARVLTEVLGAVVPPSTMISVHSPHNADAMASWLAALCGREGRSIRVSATWPEFSAGQSAAVIVANATRDHAAAVEWAIAAGVPVLVEKPMALSGADAERLVQMARHANVRLAPAHVFLFARSIERFSKMVAESGGVRSVRICWTDPSQETRYGDQKRYDASVPIFADIFPHVMSVLSMLLPTLPDKCSGISIQHGGASMELDLIAGAIPCKVELARNSDRRRRIVEVNSGNGTIVLDFSEEPGRIIRDATVVTADPEWATERRPAARLIATFLDWAVGGKDDPRLDVLLALWSCRLIDGILEQYQSLLTPWLADKFGAATQQIDDELRYALSELLQSDGLLPFGVLERQIEGVVRHFSGGCKSQMSDINITNDMNVLEVVHHVVRRVVA